MSERRYRLGVDVGGTFTDVCIYDRAAGRLSTHKVPTTHDDPGRGLSRALGAAASPLAGGVRELLDGTERLVYGTTAATNALTTGATARVGLLCSAGFRDILAIREAGKDDPFDWRLDYPPPFVPRHLTQGVTERVSAEGEVLVALDADEVVSAVERLRRARVEAIAVAYLWSFVNPDHELRTRELIASIWPEVPCKLSHEVNPIPREYRRTIATALDAALDALVRSHLLAIERALRRDGCRVDLHVVACDGGVTSIREMIQRPILAVGSGPTMAPVGAQDAVSGAVGPRSTLVVLDMGGTSLDVSIVRDGAALVSRETRVGPDLLGIARVDVRSIGAGGGSIARVDGGGLLRVGPESAGSDPGPACYGKGGTAATVTDASLVLGYLPPVLGGELELAADASRRALAPVGRALGVDVTEAAEAVVATVNQQMLGSIEDATLREGIDPREATLVAGGGACGLHAAALAAGLGVADVIVPRQAGTLSAFGALVGHLTHEHTVGAYVRSDQRALDSANRQLALLFDRATAFLARSGVAPEHWRLDTVCESRYVSQVWELDVPVHGCEDGLRLDADRLRQIVRDFHAAHERVYGVAHPEQPVELLAWRIRATALAEPLESDDELDLVRCGGADLTRRAYIDGAWLELPIVRGGRLAEPVAGPAILEEATTTVLVPPGWTLSSLPGGAYSLTTRATAQRAQPLASTTT